MDTVRRASLGVIRVRARPGERSRGLLLAAGAALPAALGRSGIVANKREGDGGTPRGTFRLCRLWWRADRMARPMTHLPARRIRPDDGWCETPAAANYNRPLKVPAGSLADRLWRTDPLYDLVIELDHNTRPRVAGRGSAVFVHVARDGLAPTAGCVALRATALRRLLARLGPRTRIAIG